MVSAGIELKTSRAQPNVQPTEPPVRDEYAMKKLKFSLEDLENFVSSYDWTTARYVQKWKLKAYRYYPTQVCFTQYLFWLYDNQCFMFHLLLMTTDKQNYLNLTYNGIFKRRHLLSLEINRIFTFQLQPDQTEAKINTEQSWNLYVIA